MIRKARLGGLRRSFGHIAGIGRDQFHFVRGHAAVNDTRIQLDEILVLKPRHVHNSNLGVEPTIWSLRVATDPYAARRCGCCHAGVRQTALLDRAGPSGGDAWGAFGRPHAHECRRSAERNPLRRLTVSVVREAERTVLTGDDVAVALHLHSRPCPSGRLGGDAVHPVRH